MSGNPVAALLLQRNENRMYTREHLQNAQLETARKLFPSEGLYAPSINASLASHRDSFDQSSAYYANNSLGRYSDGCSMKSDYAPFRSTPSDFPQRQDLRSNSNSEQPISNISTTTTTQGIDSQGYFNTQLPFASATRPVLSHMSYVNGASKPQPLSPSSLDFPIPGTMRNKRPSPGTSALRPMQVSTMPYKQDNYAIPVFKPMQQQSPPIIMSNAPQQQYVTASQRSDNGAAPFMRPQCDIGSPSRAPSGGSLVAQYRGLSPKNFAPQAVNRFGSAFASMTTSQPAQQQISQNQQPEARTQHFTLSPLAGGRFHEARPGERQNPKTGHYAECRCCKCRGSCKSWLVD